MLKWNRQKTGRPVIVAVPADLLRRLPESGPCWPRRFSREYFRRTFRKIVARAGLRGTFKKLRKSSGTSVESLHPGCGHIHLGNTRRVFELHYLDLEKGVKPTPPAMLNTRPPGE